MYIVYGASGFLGSGLTNNLTQDSKVTAVVRKSSDTWRLHQNDNLQIVKSDESEWPDLITELKPKNVICAQWAGVESVKRNDSRIQDTNVEAIIRIAEIAVQERCEKFISFGSQAETSESEELIPETFLNNGSSSYGQAKSRLAISLDSLLQHTQTNLIWPRIFSVYGPLETRDGLLPSLLKSMMNLENFDIREPSKLWSFLYIDDLVRALRLIINANLSNPVVNIGNSQLTTIFEICKTIDNDLEFPVNFSPLEKKGFFPSLEQLESLGWAPQVSLADGCAKSVTSIRQRLSAKVT
jgi:nucleoside-diphosphate-sugar epimerase